MDLQTGANGRGPLGTRTNRPVSDAGTLARTQNRPNVTQGTSLEPSGPGSARSNLTEADRDFIRQIHQAKYLDGKPIAVDRWLYLRGQYIRSQEEARREFGPTSKTVAWFQEVIDACNEEIERAKSPLGSAINALKTVLANPDASEKEMTEKLTPMVEVMHQQQVMGEQNDAAQQEATVLITKVVDRAHERRTAALEDLVRQEEAASGSVSEEKFRDTVGAAMGVERQRQMMGMSEGDEGEKKSARVTQAVVKVMQLVSERRINALKALIDREKKSMGSVSDQKFNGLVRSVLGDEHQNQLMGISDDKSGGLQAVVDVMELIMKRRKAAVDSLIKRQSTGGSGVTNAQINQAISDFDAIRAQARLLGMAVPEGRVTPGAPQIEQQ
jgi:hypothetical protein